MDFETTFMDAFKAWLEEFSLTSEQLKEKITTTMAGL